MSAKDLRIGGQVLVKGKDRKWKNQTIKRLHETCVSGPMAGKPHVHIVHSEGEVCKNFDSPA